MQMMAIRCVLKNTWLGHRCPCSPTQGYLIVHAKKILVPIDFSHTGDVALEYASSLAKEHNSLLMLVHVQELPRSYWGEMYYGIPEPSREELNNMLSDVQAGDDQVDVQYLLLSGHPAGAIVQLAEDEGVDLIVLGSHGRTGFSRAILGSVAEAIVRHATCPVLVCKPQHTVAA